MEDIRRTQDNHLIALENVLGRIGDTSQKIAGELDDHIVLLEDLDEHVERSADGMGFLRQRMSKLLQTNNNFHLTTIMILSVVVVVLLFLVLFD